MLSATALTVEPVTDRADRRSPAYELRRQHLAAAVRLWPTDRLAAAVHMRRVLALKRREGQGGRHA